MVLNLTAYQHGVRVHQNHRGFSEQQQELNYGKHAKTLFEGYKLLLVIHVSSGGFFWGETSVKSLIKIIS